MLKKIIFVIKNWEKILLVYKMFRKINFPRLENANKKIIYAYEMLLENKRKIKV